MRPSGRNTSPQGRIQIGRHDLDLEGLLLALDDLAVRVGQEADLAFQLAAANAQIGNQSAYIRIAQLTFEGRHATVGDTLPNGVQQRSVGRFRQQALREQAGSAAAGQVGAVAGGAGAGK
jgi:hypothetical protein